MKPIAIFVFISFVGLVNQTGPASATTQPTTTPSTRPTTVPSIEVRIDNVQTCERLGACQGASEHDGFVYLYGDADPGVIRQFTVDHSGPTDLHPRLAQLTFTGLEISLTRDGENIINHPTGLTWNSQFGTYLGNTVTKTKKGTIYHLNWPQMLIDRNLDHAVLNVIDDDTAVQGCRPEFVRHGDQWLLATADYGHLNNQVRFYDPEKLATARKTSEPGVMVAKFPCLPFVQQLHWVDSRGILIMIENQIEGRRWRLVPIDPWNTPDFRMVQPYDALPNTDELEGFSMLDPDHCVLVTSSRKNNVTMATIHLGMN